MQDAILALNAGSSSIKFGVYDIGGDDLTTAARRAGHRQVAAPCD